MFACRLDECPPGLFLKDGCLGFKSEYRTESGYCDAYVVESGEYFWGATNSVDDREAMMVIPVKIDDSSCLSIISSPLPPS